MTSPADLRAAAQRLERFADRRARRACTLAGRAAFLDRQGQTARAAELDALAREEADREASALDRALALKAEAAALDGRRSQARALAALAIPLRPGAAL